MRREPTLSEIAIFWTYLWEMWAVTALAIPAALMREVSSCSPES